MRTALLSAAALALGLGAFAAAPASAAPIATHATIAAPAAVSDVACRTVRKTVWRNGVKRTVTSRECDRANRSWRRDRVVERRYRPGPRPYYRPAPPRPGIGIYVR
ncbi:hypothetical protein [Hansschlegelia beijingensis]|uniref:Uncharacterized protein n=1 Tax=Hansschlegelia beijingensis TaxID=1133344 RepID=A0A7W6GGC2_9HYPH|nr:hypothetical protein [Hansschlegelia beijingensis]MBB3973877.1 hypothetical protein [Hansschlegelia beijingensis]